MYLTRSEYDRGVNTFSPEGRLFQVEYAIEAIKQGSTAIGIQTQEGIVLAVEKRLTSPLLESNSIEKVSLTKERWLRLTLIWDGIIRDLIDNIYVLVFKQNVAFGIFLMKRDKRPTRHWWADTQQTNIHPCTYLQRPIIQCLERHDISPNIHSLQRARTNK